MPPYVAQRYDVFIAQEAVYGEMPTAPLAYQQIRPETDGFKHDGKHQRLERDYMRADLFGSPGLSGAPSCSLAFSLPARGGSQIAGAGMQAEACPELSHALNACVARVHTDSGMALASGDSANLVVNGGLPSDAFTAGGLVFVDPDGSGTFHPRWICALDDLETSLDLSSLWRGGAAWDVPGVVGGGGLGAACTQFMPGQDGAASACVEIAGLQSGDARPVWRYKGLVGSLKINDSTAASRVLLGFEFSGDDFERGELQPLASLAGGSSAWPAAPADLRALSADLRLNGSPLAYHGFSFDMGNKWAERSNANRPSGRDGYALTRIAPTFRLTVYWNPTHHQRLTSGETIDISWVVGGPDNAIGLHAPNAEIVEIKESEINGLLAMDISAVALPSGIDGIEPFTLAIAGVCP